MNRKIDGDFIVAFVGNMIGFILGWFIVGPKISDKFIK